jgi:hypothetical protein
LISLVLVPFIFNLLLLFKLGLFIALPVYLLLYSTTSL